MHCQLISFAFHSLLYRFSLLESGSPSHRNFSLKLHPSISLRATSGQTLSTKYFFNPACLADKSLVLRNSSESKLSFSSLLSNFPQFFLIGNHVISYVENYNNPMKEASLMAITYQKIWGLSPNPPIRRAVIGESVLFPMLLVYPEDLSLISLANKKYFQVITSSMLML